MTYVKIIDGVVAQKQPYEAPGFIEAPNSIVCGMLFDGGVFSSPDINPVVDAAVITPRQARLALHGAGLLDTVESELAKPENKAAKITWEYALEIRRDDPLIATFSAILGLTDAQIDALFETAKTL